MKHEHVCDECEKVYDCPQEELSEEDCSDEELPVCNDCL